MGSYSTKSTRRLSFENKMVLKSPISVQHSIENKTASLENLTVENADEVVYKPKNMTFLTQDDEKEYWSCRIENLKKEHQEINNIVLNEYEKTVEETNFLYKAPTITFDKLQKVKPCFDWRAKIMKCYEDNPRQPLVCSGIVQQFSQCVTSYRFEE